jgi:hypothetical protein
MSTTDGFAVVAELRAPFVGDIVTTYFDAGAFPNPIDGVDLTPYGYRDQIDITLEKPLLWLDTDIPGEMELSISALATLHSGGQFTMGIDGLVAPVPSTVNGDQAVVLPLANLEDLTVTIDNAVPNEAALQQALTNAIPNLLQRAPQVTLAPTFASRFNTFQVQVMDDTAESGRTNLGVFLSHEGDGDPNQVPLFIRASEDFAVALSSQTVTAFADDAIKKQLGPLPHKIPGHDNVTLDSFSVSLTEGGVAVKGHATIDPGPCLPNIGVDIGGTADVSLNADGTIKVDPHLTVGEGVWFWIISFLLGGLTLIIAEIILDAVAASMLDNAAVQLSQNLSTTGLFNRQLPPAGGSGPITVNTTVSRLTIHSDAAVLAGTAALAP